MQVKNACARNPAVSFTDCPTFAIAALFVVFSLARAPAAAEIVYFCDDQGRVGVIDTATMATAAVGSLPMQGFTINQVLGMAYDPVRDRILILDRNSSTVYTMNPATGIASVLFTPPTIFQGGAVIGDTLYGIDENNQRVVAYSLTTFGNVLTSPSLLMGHSHGMGVDAVTGQLYVRNGTQIYEVDAMGTPGAITVTTVGSEDCDPLATGEFLAVDYGREIDRIDRTTGLHVVLMDTTALSAVGVTSAMSGLAVRQGGNTLRVRIVDTAATTVRQGQTGIALTVSVENIGTAAVNINSVGPLFFDAALVDVSTDYIVTPAPGNPTAIGGMTIEIFTFSIDLLLAATTGTITIDAAVSGVDPVTMAPHSDSDADTTDTWDVVPCLAPMCGDCNGDLLVTILDALVAAQHSAALIALSGVSLSNCNVIGALEPDPMAVVSILDALTLAQFAAGLPVALVCC